MAYRFWSQTHPHVLGFIAPGQLWHQGARALLDECLDCCCVCKRRGGELLLVRIVDALQGRGMGCHWSDSKGVSVTILMRNIYVVVFEGDIFIRELSNESYVICARKGGDVVLVDDGYWWSLHALQVSFYPGIQISRITREQFIIYCGILFGFSWPSIAFESAVFVVKPDGREGDYVKLAA